MIQLPKEPAPCCGEVPSFTKNEYSNYTLYCLHCRRQEVGGGKEDLIEFWNTPLLNDLSWLLGVLEEKSPHIQLEYYASAKLYICKWDTPTETFWKENEVSAPTPIEAVRKAIESLCDDGAKHLEEIEGGENE